MSRNRNSSLCLPLCNSLELRYSISVVAAPTNKYNCGYFSSARFYFYSTVIKKMIGKSWQKAYKFTKKEEKAAGDNKPSAHQIRQIDLQEALANLLTVNKDIRIEVKNKKGIKTAQSPYNTNELLVFWLTHFTSIYSLITSAQTESGVNKRMAKYFMNSKIASFDLTLLENSNQDVMKSACKSLVSYVKVISTGKTDKTTVGVNQTVHILRYAIDCYFNEKNINSSLVNKFLLKESHFKSGPVAKTTRSMRLKSISISRYKELWSALTVDKNPFNTALILMITLGLSAEEVCGLKKEDFRQIPERPGFYQLRITHKYSLNQANKYNYEVLGDEFACRNIPLPFQLRKLVEIIVEKSPASSQYLFCEKNHALQPEKLITKLQQILYNSENTLYIKDNHGNPKKVDIAFQYKSYRDSCRHYWQYHCGMTDGEICYLSALAPPDTAAAHYIDFNNGSMQYRMLKQMEYGIALFASEDRHYESQNSWIPVNNDPFYSSGELDKRASMYLCIENPVKIEIASNRGVKIYMEGKNIKL